MADVLRIKRRSGGAPGAPSTLANAELAYNEVDDVLYYGKGTGGAGGSATSCVAIAGQGLSSSSLPAMNGTASAGSATTWAKGDHVHPTDTSRAPLASPALTGTPTAPTVTPASDNSTKVATTAFVQSAISAVSAGVTSITVSNGLSGGGTGVVNIGITANGIANASLGQMAAHTYKGNNTGATASPIDVTAAQLLTDIAAAPLASPTFTGVPAAPTASPGTNTTQLATTAFVTAAMVTPWNTAPAMDGTAYQGASAAYARGDHVHPTDTSRAPLASPTFTGVPAAPTPTNGTNTTQIATTAFVLATRLDQLAVPTADVSMGGRKITSVNTPTATTDAANKAYVDNLSQGLDTKMSVKAATTATLTLSGTQTVDGVALVANDRCLVKDQTASAANGIYVVQSGAWTRAIDMDTWAEVPAAYVFVEQGTVNADTGWVCTSDQGGTLDTTAITWSQFSGAGASPNAGAGLTKTGNTFDVVGTTNRIIANADSIDIAATYVGQTSITTLGTVGTGTWQGTAVAVAYGGTGVATLTGYVKGSGTSPLTASATIPNTDITGLGTMSTQNASAVAITGGTIDGITLDGGTF